MTPLGQSQRLDLDSLHWHQLGPGDPVACDWSVITILASDWSRLSPEEVTTTGLVTGTRAVQGPGPPSSFTERISSNFLAQFLWRRRWSPSHTVPQAQVGFFKCHKHSDNAKNFVGPLGKFCDVLQLFSMEIFRDNAIFSAQGPPRKSWGTYFHVKLKNN